MIELWHMMVGAQVAEQSIVACREELVKLRDDCATEDQQLWRGGHGSK